MKLSIVKYLVVVFGLFLSFHISSQTIKTKTPKRPKGQQDVLRLACEPIPVVRVAVIGLGMRGSEAVSRLTYID
jgi:hypothetical protein